MGPPDETPPRREGRESDQRPEEAPDEQVVDDVPEETRREAATSPGAAGEDGERQTGQPDESE
jgi:hypothetical protein